MLPVAGQEVSRPRIDCSQEDGTILVGEIDAARQREVMEADDFDATLLRTSTPA